MSKPTRDIWDVNVKMGRDLPADVETVDSLLEALGQAVQDRSDVVLICHLGRELVKAVLVSRSTEVWTRQRVGESLRLLKDAADATVGSPYERNCSDRARDFRRALACLRDEERSCAPLRAAFAGV